MPTLTIPLRGPAGEPVDFRRTINSHGVASLPPITPDADPATALRATLRLPDGRIETVAISSDHPETLTVVTAAARDQDTLAAIVVAVRHILRLDQDLSPLYAKVARACPERSERDPALAWVAAGAGRMMRCQTVFEDVVKTICTTHCTWSGTVRMVEGIVRHLGELAPDAFEDDLPYRAFPTPAAMAEADPRLYREVARCGYRGAYLQALARNVVAGEIDLEAMATATPEELPDDELAKQLVALPGVGPYAAAHVMTMLRRYSRLVLDSWTRPTYAKLAGRDAVPDAEIRERFAGFGEHAGLAFWMAITRGRVDAVADASIPPRPPEEPEPN